MSLSTGEVAKLFVTVGANTGAAAKELTNLSGQVDKFAGKMGAWKQTMGAAFGPVIDSFGRLGDAADGVRSVIGAVAGLAQTVFSGAARNEQYATSFEVLLGSASKATAHIEKLKEFATETPFTLPGIVETSKLLEVMGGASLNTIENLRLIGDVASGTGTEIDRVGVQFGRLYDGLKNGTPLGEVMMRLGEMGAISGDSRRKILAMAEAVSKGTMTMEEAWASATKEFGRFAGQTGKQSQTLAGLWSTFTDTIDDGFARIGTKLLPLVKPLLKGAIDLFGQLADAAIYVMDNFDKFAPMIVAVMVPAIAVLAGVMWSLAGAVIAATWPFLAIGVAIGALVFVVASILDKLGLMDEFITFVGQAFEIAILPIKLAAAALGFLGEVLDNITGKAATTGANMTGFAGNVGKAADDIYAATPAVGDAADGLYKTVPDAADEQLPAATQTLRGALAEQLGLIKEAEGAVTGAANSFYDALTQAAKVNGDITRARQRMNDKDMLEDMRGTNAAKAAIARSEYAAARADYLKALAERATIGTNAQQLEKTEALLASKELAEAMKSKDPEILAAASLFKEALLERARKLRTDMVATTKGTQNAVKVEMLTGFRAMEQQAGVWGYRTGAEFAAQLKSTKGLMTAAAIYAVNGAALVMRTGSPPGPISPLHEIDTWGKVTGEVYMEGLTGALDRLKHAVQGSLAPTASALAPSQKTMAGTNTGGSGGGGLTVAFEFDSTVPYSPAEQVELAQRVGPAVYEYLVARGAV